MAEQEQTGKNAKFINSVTKGLSTDTSPGTQPDGSYRWALNAIHENADGDLGFLTNEAGTYECGEIGNDWALIGHVYIEDDEAIAFLAPKDASFASPYYGWGRIVRIKKDCTVKVLVTSDCLNFKINHQIQAIVRVRNGCELNIYWTDNFNDIRHINLDSLMDYVAVGKETYLSDHPEGDANDYRLSPYDHHDDSSLWDCENMKLFPDFSMPCIELQEITEGGSLAAGVYQFAVQYLDQDFNPVNWTDLTQPIPIYDSPLNHGALGIKGSSPGSVQPDGSTASGYMVDGNITNKAILLKFTNLDTSFKYLRVATLASTGGVGANIEGGRLLIEIPITADTEYYAFGEYNDTTTTFLHLDELTVDRKVFTKAKTIAQHSNRLILGNMSEAELPHTDLSRAAQNIEITYTTRALDADDPKKESPVSGKFYFDYRPYMRDEIYAFGISFIFNDGTSSPAYHIPGREMNYSAANSKKWSYDSSIDEWSYANTGAALITSGDYNVPGAAGYTIGEHNREIATNGWDSSIIVTASNWPVAINPNVGHLDPNTVNVQDELLVPYQRGSGDVYRWEVYNTCIRTQAGFDGDSYYITKGEMGYYECRNYIYPATRDCKGVPIYPHEDLGNGEYAMHFVRHHRMPDTTMEAHNYGDPSITEANIDDFGENPFSTSADPIPRVVTLGIEANNVQVPASIATQIQGYKIVRARTEATDRTVLDKGIMFYTIVGANFWLGSDAASKSAPAFPSQCTFQMQANHFNKHIAASACVHMTGSGTINNIPNQMESADYLTDATSFLWMGDRGSTTPIGSDYYIHQFGEESFGFHGWTANVLHKDFGRYACLACPGDDPDAGNNHDDNLGGCPDNTTISDSAAGKDNERYANFFGPLIMYHLFSAAYQTYVFDVIPDEIHRGNGYPLGFWGSNYLSTVNGVGKWGRGRGVNVGYFTDVEAWPCHVMGYHGPKSKFESIEGASYVKAERILIGYNKLINCNSACCCSDVGTASGTRRFEEANNTSSSTAYSWGHNSGIGNHVPNRCDGYGYGGGTYIYSRASYQVSAVPPNHIGNAIRDGYENQSPSCHSSGDTGRCDYIWRDSVHANSYKFPMSNVLLNDFVKLEPNSGEHFIPTMGQAPWIMSAQQQEVLLLSCGSKDKNPVNYAWAWPYYNQGFTRIPYDSSWSQISCGYMQGSHTRGSWSGWDDDGQDSWAPSGPANQTQRDSGRGLLTAFYVSIKKNAYDVHGAIGNLLYHPTHNCMIGLDDDLPSAPSSTGPIFGGDSFISRFAFKQLQDSRRCGNEIRWNEDDKCTEWTVEDGDTAAFPDYSPPVIAEQRAGFMESRYGYFYNIVWYWTESYINTELRLGQDADGQRIYPYHFEGPLGGFGALSFVDETGIDARGAAPRKFAEFDSAQSDNYYAMNRDYNKINSENIYSPLPLNFDFCADCQQDHPYRITYSEQTFQEEQRDRYKSFLANNYKDIPAHRGQIWNMYTLNNSVYIHTAESMWRIDPSRNVVSPADGERSVYIGTGDFFSNEIQEILQSDHGYLGCQSQWATMQTESGTFWPDERQGHVFLQQQNPKDLTNIGMKNWFESNMNINIYDQYQDIYGVDFPFIDNPANPAGAGFVATYDIRHNRFILTKRDYKLIAPWNTTDSNSPYYQVISADPYSGNWVISGGQAADCNCLPNPLWEDFDNYAVTEITNALTGVQECQHTWQQSVTTSITNTIPSDTDIWVFYDTTSMSDPAATTAKATIQAWVDNENVPGGLLANWSGQQYHKSVGCEQWILWPRTAVTGLPAGTWCPTFDTDYGNSAAMPTPSTNALVICLVDESNPVYHGTTGQPGGGPLTAQWNADVAAFKAVWTAHTSGGGILDTLVYPVGVCGTSTDAAKDDFVRQVACAIHGSNMDSLAVHTNGNPISPYANANMEQDPVSGACAGLVDLSNGISGNNSGTGNWLNNPYRAEEPLYNYGVKGRYDRRTAASFQDDLGDDISDFVSAQTITTYTTTTTDFEQITPCNWANMMDTGSDICATCGNNDIAGTLDITLNDNTVEVINNLNQIFDCDSWTISFGIGVNQWISFHSYIPHYYVPMRNHFYSGLNIGAWNVQKGTHIYRHGLNNIKNNYQVYYGCIQPFVVDLISNDSPLTVNTYDNFHFMADASYYDPATGSYVDDRYITFDSVYLYNDYQVTGNLNFNIKDTNVNTMMSTSVNEVSNQIALERKERTWGFNGFRDMAIARGTTSLFTSAWSSLSTTTWMDKAINPLAVSTAKPWFERQYLSDKYLGIRLFFSNLAGQGKHKLVTKYVYGSAQPNIR